ncbi:MAG TPA: DUF4405 domain-containing protein [Bacteroidetes bacterium]|nr:DUF4405 domain-containing protein [Bacteroidota bacterium]
MKLAKWCNNRAKLNLIIDALLLIQLMAMAGIGFLIKYILVPGEERNLLYGRDVELYFLELTRHDWGKIHLWASISFLVLILLHIILHWKMIGCIFRQMFASKKVRTAIACVLLAISIFLAVSPFLVRPEVDELPRKGLHMRFRESLPPSASENRPPDPEEQKSSEIAETYPFSVQTPDRAPEHESALHEMEIYGYMTLEQVAGQFDVPVSGLCEKLCVPLSKAGQRISRLKRIYNFHTSKIKKSVQEIGGSY